MSKTVTVTEARADLPSLLDAVERGQEITISRHGKPVAVLMSVDLARRRRTARSDRATEEIARLIEEGRGRPLKTAASLTPERAEAWIAEIRAERDRDRS